MVYNFSEFNRINRGLKKKINYITFPGVWTSLKEVRVFKTDGREILGTFDLFVALHSNLTVKGFVQFGYDILNFLQKHF